ncbi:uncharacterized protein LACBIDRAFT_331379 [Laccaria bicolor S238N-H82]|uniref:Predicted protein n=1 Tax=Laccaria bicolor (strain S238N-H82 / ATCC MYA-4686) TaxID=486041 RepID=B0DPB2_LACBS|nr:uncharacterized protein LACBIDRAFT_331379 [Laccaria bicolor S238N-H82]EDR03585.1 predicted protein [Laccaria bicolor S238N-H82]|eukprot:XP_001885733.1 predicted protein [Laccaria bicolor S238N-H82]
MLLGGVVRAVGPDHGIQEAGVLQHTKGNEVDELVVVEIKKFLAKTRITGSISYVATAPSRPTQRTLSLNAYLVFSIGTMHFHDSDHQGVNPTPRNEPAPSHWAGPTSACSSTLLDCSSPSRDAFGPTFTLVEDSLSTISARGHRTRREFAPIFHPTSSRKVGECRRTKGPKLIHRAIRHLTRGAKNAVNCYQKDCQPRLLHPACTSRTFISRKFLKDVRWCTNSGKMRGAVKYLALGAFGASRFHPLVVNFTKTPVHLVGWGSLGLWALSFPSFPHPESLHLRHFNMIGASVLASAHHFVASNGVAQSLLSNHNTYEHGL